MAILVCLSSLLWVFLYPALVFGTRLSQVPSQGSRAGSESVAAREQEH